MCVCERELERDKECSTLYVKYLVSNPILIKSEGGFFLSCKAFSVNALGFESTPCFAASIAFCPGNGLSDN